MILANLTNAESVQPGISRFGNIIDFDEAELTILIENHYWEGKTSKVSEELTKFNPCHGADDGKFCSTGGSSIKVKAVKGKVFTGEPTAVKTKLTKLETGAIGEAVVLNYLKSKGQKDTRLMNVKVNNFAVDLLQNHSAIEVKTGLVSNGVSAQKWRATIGQPGKKEAAWLAKALPEKKAAWNEKKMASILDRKQAALKSLSKTIGRKVSGETFGLIINPDTKRADLFKFSGFHLHIRWNKPTTKDAYVGTFTY